MTTKTPQEIYELAVKAGYEAAQACSKNDHSFGCGFAWVIVKPARGPFVSWCKANKHGRSGYEPGYHFWYSEFDNTMTQSVSVHYAAAQAFADVLKENGLNAVVGSRLD